MNIEGDPFARIKSDLRKHIRVGMELVELEWKFKGEKIYLLGIVSNEHGGIIYDNIGHFVKGEAPTSASRNLYVTSPTLKTRAENGDKDKDGDGDDSGSGSGSGGTSETIVKRFFGIADNDYNFYGVEIWAYSIECESVFTDGILTDRQLFAYSDGSLGWSCKAAIKTVSGELYESGYHEFSYAVGIGYLASITIAFEGSGFTISGGSSTKIEQKYTGRNNFQI